MAAQTSATTATKTLAVTPDNFIRAETDWYFRMFVGRSGIGQWFHHREPPPLDAPGVRPNRDTLYTEAVFDLDAGPVTITLPDGSERRFDGPVTGDAVARSIGAGLAKAALAIKVDGELRDLSRAIEKDAKIEIVTRDHPDALELLRHDCAHVLAEAVQELYPGTQITFGPAIENGLYYDFVRDEPFTPDDFAKIEKRMAGLASKMVGKELRWLAENGAPFLSRVADTYPEPEET